MTVVVLFYFFLFAFWLENVLGFSLTSVQGLSLLNTAYYLLLFIWAAVALRKRVLFEENRVNKYLLLLLCVVIASIPVKIGLREVDNVSLVQELVYLKGWLNPVLLFFILYNVLNEERHCRLALHGLTLFLGVAAVSTITAQLGLLHLAGIKVMQDRAAGFAEPNQLAACFVLFLPLLLSGVLFGAVKRKLFSLLFVFLTLVSLLITGSRGGVLALCFSGFVYLGVFSRRKLIRSSYFILIVLLVSPLLGVSTFMLTPENVRHSIMTRLDPTKSVDAYEYTSGRTVLWQNGFQLFLKSPLYGHGQATFVPLMKKNFPVWANSHNDYLLYLVHFGLIGLCLFLVVLGSLFNQSWELAEHSESRATTVLTLSYFSGLAGFAFAMFGVNIIQPLYLFWAYSAIVLKAGRIASSPQSATSCSQVFHAHC